MLAIAAQTAKARLKRERAAHRQLIIETWWLWGSKAKMSFILECFDYLLVLHYKVF